jgi:hypothetical protein
MGYRFTVVEKIGLRNLGVKFLGKDKEWYFGRYLFTVDFCADGMDLDTGFTEQAEEHKSFNWIALENGQFACQPNNRCLWYDQRSAPRQSSQTCVKQRNTCGQSDAPVNGVLDDNWFYDIEEKK